MNPRCAPQFVASCHLADEGADLRIDGWAAVWSGRAPSGPPAPEPVAMPAHHGVRLNEHQRRAPVPPESSKHNPKQSIARQEARAFGRAFRRHQLLPQGEVLQHQFVMPAECERQSAADQDEQVQHATDFLGPNVGNQPGRVLASVNPVLNGPVREWPKANHWRARRAATEGQRYVELSRQLRVALRSKPAGARNLAELDLAIWQWVHDHL